MRGREIAALLDSTGIGCLVLGETIGGLLFPRCSFLSFTPTFWAGVAVLTLRHVIWPRPSLFAALANRVRAYWREQGVARTWSVALASRVAVLAVGVLVVLGVGYTLRPLQFRVSRNELVNLPARFDAGWYLGIARHGYQWRPELRGHQQNVAFFPVYPALMRVGGDVLTIAAKVTRNPRLFGGGDARMLWGGALVSVLCFGWALRQVMLLAQLEQPEGSVPARGVMLLAAYPFSLFFSAPYPESVFLLVLASTVLAWNRGDMRSAGLLGALAGFTRSNGWTVSAALLTELILGPRPRDRTLPRFLVAVCPLFGAALFSAYVWHLTGDPFEWTRAQEGWGRQVALTGFLAHRIDAIQNGGLLAYLMRDPVDAITCGCTAWMLVMAAVLAVRRRWLYSALIVFYLLPAIAIDLPALGRMTAVLFPAFIASASLVRGRAYAALVVLLGVGQAFLAGRFFLWQPPY